MRFLFALLLGWGGFMAGGVRYIDQATATYDAPQATWAGDNGSIVPKPLTAPDNGSIVP